VPGALIGALLGEVMSSLRKDRRKQRLAAYQMACALSDPQKKAATEAKRRRRKVKFALNVSSPADRELYDFLMELKSQNLMTAYLRQGVALYSSLKDGENLDMLFSMFGWAKEVLNPQIDAMLSLSTQMEVLERMMADSGHQSIDSPRQLLRLDEDNFDTEKLRVVTKEATGENDSVSTFLSSFGEMN
jgi:hypothetical protein